DIRVLENENSIEVYDYYKTIPNGELHGTLIGVWNLQADIIKEETKVVSELTNSTSRDQFLLAVKSFNVWRERRNLSEVVTKCVIGNTSKTFVILRKLANGTNEVEGPMVEMLKYLQKILGFRYRIVESDQRGYGTYNKSTNTWSGYISEILKKKADILVIDLDITHTRFRVVDYLTQIGCEM
ncbi:Glutamate receptor ionotropic, kainate 3, partial [Armadillidium vulgare]